jgi:glycosyltransferase involved in cell wall biosynthesis
MKLVMFTPIDKRSAIARVASLEVDELLSSGHHVTVVRTEVDHSSTNPCYGFDCEVLYWTDHEAVRHAVSTHDASVYQVGNSYGFHAGAVEWMPEHRGVVCLHDFYLGHLFRGWAEATAGRSIDDLEVTCGAEAVAAWRAAEHSPKLLELTAKDAPLTEWICRQSLAVITHGNWGIERVRVSTPGPVLVQDLPYSRVQDVRVVAPLPRPAGVFNVLTLGHVNENKRVPSVIGAIASSQSIRDRVAYRVVGAIAPRTVISLSALARMNNVRLQILGEVDDAAIGAELDRADLVVALRQPCLEAASASVIESMLAGKPTVVTRSGWYDELPDDCVIKVDPQSELPELSAVLERLLADPIGIAKIGARAEIYATQHFRADNYAKSLVNLTEQAIRIQPRVEFLDAIAQELAAWEDIPGSLDITSVIESATSLWTNESLGHSH